MDCFQVDMHPPMGGGGRSHDGYEMRGGGGGGGHGGQQGGYGNNYTTESTFVIPADKCGLVIGKGMLVNNSRVGA